MSQNLSAGLSRSTSMCVAAIGLGLALVSACSGSGEEVETSPTPDEWQPPVFEGDGLPPSENTDHDALAGALRPPARAQAGHLLRELVGLRSVRQRSLLR